MMRAIGFGFAGGVGWSAWSNATEGGAEAPVAVRALVMLLALAFLLAWFGPRSRRSSSSHASAHARAESRSVATAGVVVNIVERGGPRAGEGFEILDTLPAPPAFYALSSELDDEQDEEESSVSTGGPTPQAQRAAAPLVWRTPIQ